MPLSQPPALAHPLDPFERLADLRDWPAERTGEDEIALAIAGAWGTLDLTIGWRQDIESLHVACAMDLKIPPPRRAEAGRLVGLVNEGLFLGHFDLWREDGSVMFRNALILAGAARVTSEQCDALIRTAIETCERYHPSFQFVAWAGKSAEEAIEAGLFETVGEA